MVGLAITNSKESIPVGCVLHTFVVPGGRRGRSKVLGVYDPRGMVPGVWSQERYGPRDIVPGRYGSKGYSPRWETLTH